jgi:molybdopterin-guanine dinucleotide biosynthesis protein A
VGRAAIILAGGQAKRFQVKGERWIDKALAELFDKPLLIHIIERVMPVVDETIICVNSQTRKLKYSRLLQHYSIRHVKLCIDGRFTFVKKGPAVAIATGLKATDADYCIILPCDTPFIQPSVVEYLFNAVKGADIAVPIHPNGKLETLMMTCKRSTIVHIAETLCELGRDRPDDIIRGASEVIFVSTVSELKNHDPEFESFINLNSREDLKRLTTRVVKDGPVRESIHLKLCCPTESELVELKIASKYYFQKNFLKAFTILSSLSTRLESRGLNFWTAISRDKEGETLLRLSSGHTKMRGKYHMKAKLAFMKAAENYCLEAEIYEKKHVDFLAKRARSDGLWSASRLNPRPDKRFDAYHSIG